MNTQRNTNIKFVNIGDPMLDGHAHGSRDMWHYAYGNHFSQVGNYLEDIHHNIEWTTNYGIVEIPLKTWYHCDKLIEWFVLLSDEQRKLIKRNQLLFSYAMEPYSDILFREIEKFADYLNKSHQDVAVAVSNSHENLQDLTTLKVFALRSGWMQWFCKRWMDKNAETQALELPWKPYMCLNARPRMHRLVTLGHMAKAGILDQGHVSLGAGKGTILGTELNGPVDKETYIKLCERFDIPVFDSLANQLPISIDDTQTQFDWSKSAGLDVVNDAFVNNWQATGECGSAAYHYTLTEKTWRPIYYGMPFVLRSTNESIDYTKQLGYHMYDDLHENTGDSIADFVSDFCKLSRRTIDNFRKNCRKHNRELFLLHCTMDIDNLAQQVREWIN